MICLEVTVNGKAVCTAGVGEYGLLTLLLTWVKCPPEELHDDRDERTGVPQLAVGGLHGSVSLEWLHPKLKLQVGDEVSVRIVEREQSDEPMTRSQHPSSEEMMRQSYEYLKGRFEKRGETKTTTPPTDYRRDEPERRKRELEYKPTDRDPKELKREAEDKLFNRGNVLSPEQAAAAKKARFALYKMLKDEFKDA